MTEPLHVHWDRTVIHSTGPGDDTIVCCLDQNRHPVALFLDDELRESLGLSLLDPNGEMDQADSDAMTPQRCPAGIHADWAVDSESAHACPWCEIGRLRELLALPELTSWAEQLQSADLTPHPAFAWCGTTTGYEAAVQVATTDRLTGEARERLIAELQQAFDETVRRVLGYRPAGGAKAVAKADLGVLVSCYALSCPNGEYSRLAEQRGWTVHSLGMWCCPKHPAAALEAGQ